MGCCSRDLALITDTLCGLKTLITRVGNTFLKLMGLEADVGELGPQRLLETTTGRERRMQQRGLGGFECICCVYIL